MPQREMGRFNYMLNLKILTSGIAAWPHVPVHGRVVRARELRRAIFCCGFNLDTQKDIFYT